MEIRTHYCGSYVKDIRQTSRRYLERPELRFLLPPDGLWCPTGVPPMLLWLPWPAPGGTARRLSGGCCSCSGCLYSVGSRCYICHQPLRTTQKNLQDVDLVCCFGSDRQPLGHDHTPHVFLCFSNYGYDDYCSVVWSDCPATCVSFYCAWADVK